MKRVFEDSRCRYGARMVWLQLDRDGIQVARCTVEWLMRAERLQGVRRGGKKRTANDETLTTSPADSFAAPRPS